jgi:hypothetical protein
MRKDDEFGRAMISMRDAVLRACKPDGSSLDGPGHVLAMGAVFCELVTLNIGFLVSTGQSDLAREVLEAMESDLMDIRRANGWLNA